MDKKNTQSCHIHAFIVWFKFKSCGSGSETQSRNLSLRDFGNHKLNHNHNHNHQFTLNVAVHGTPRSEWVAKRERNDG